MPQTRSRSAVRQPRRRRFAIALRSACHIMPPMTLEEITARICAFRDARDWMQFHNPKEMAVAITAEAGELLQHFVWQQPDQLDQRVKEKMPELKDEMADVGILLFELAHNLGVDLGQAMLDKVERNETRYPVAKARGSNAKYNEL